MNTEDERLQVNDGLEKSATLRMAIVGILGNIFLAVFKLIAGIIGNSSAMLSDAIHTVSDVFATIVAFIGVSFSKKKADREHPYGHERIECVASLILGVILAFTGLGIGYTGIRKLFFERDTIEIPTLLPLIAAIVSIVVKEAMFWYTMYYAKRLDSAAFKADAWHHRSDAISSVGSFIGIGLAKLGFPIMDPIASLLICALIIKVSIDIFRDALNKMLDTSCDNAFEQKVRALVEGSQGVQRIDLLRTRQFGNKIYIDLEIAVKRDISLLDAHSIAESVHDDVEKTFPKVKQVIIHVNPGDE